MNKRSDRNSLLFDTAADTSEMKDLLSKKCDEVQRLREELAILTQRAAESEQKYAELFDFVPSGYLILSSDHIIMDINPGGSQIIGKEKAGLIGKNFDDYVDENTTSALNTFYRNIMASRNREFCEVAIKRSSGQIRNVFIEGKVKGKSKEILLNIVDNTSLGQLSILLQQTRQNYETFFNSLEEFLFVTDNDGKILYTNLTTRKFLGYKESELSGVTFWKLHPENRRSEAATSFFSALSGAMKSIIIPLKTKSGTEIPVEIRLLQGDWDGKPAVFAIGSDITAQKLAEHSLQISEKKYRTILNASPDGMILIDLNGIITEISELGMELLGAQKRNDMIGLHISDFVPDEQGQVISEIIEKTISDGLTQNVEVVIKKKNESHFPGELSATLIQSPDGSPLSFMIILRDLTQRKKAAAKQLHADRMANLGEMASGIAHEINQPLNIISMILDKILFDSARSNKVDINFIKEKSDRIFENITRIRNIIDQIRAFSRSHDDYVLTTFSINHAIEKAVSMITEQFKHLGINLILTLEKDLPEIYGNTYKFEQVIVNLLVNAKDALMEKKSSARNFTCPEIAITSWHEVQTIIVEVADNGIGIKDVDINNVILPFYTTKAEGKGTGLGLSICYQIIKEMNGTIDIKSSRTSGTKITMSIDQKKISM